MAKVKFGEGQNRRAERSISKNKNNRHGRAAVRNEARQARRGPSRQQGRP